MEELMAIKKIKPTKKATQDEKIVLIEQLPLSIIIIVDNKLEYLNKKTTATFDISTKTTLTQFLSLVHTTDKKEVDAVIKKGDTATKTVKIKNKKNIVISTQLTSKPILWNTKKALQLTIENQKSKHEEEMRLLMQNAKDFIFKYVFDPDRRYVFASDSAYSIFGYTPEEFYKDPMICFKTVHPDDYDLMVGPQTKDPKKQPFNTPKKLILRFVKKQGDIIWTETHYNWIKNKEGKVESVEGITRDITELMTKELELEQKWINYKNLIDISPMGIAIHKKNSIIFSNPTFKKLLGLKKISEDVDFIEFLPKKYQKELVEQIKAARKNQETKPISVKLENTKKQSQEIEVRSSPVIYNGATAVQTVFVDLSEKLQLQQETLRAELAEQYNKGLLKEIDERVKAERKLKENEKQILNQSAKLKAIFESGDQLMWTINKNLEITSFNQNFYNTILSLYGIKTVANKKLEYPLKKKLESIDYLKQWNEKYNEVFKSGKTVEFIREQPNTKGQKTYRQVFLYPIYDQENKITEISGIAYDITENKLNEEKIAQSLKEKEVLLKEVHHRVKNNMQVISSILNLQSSYVSDEKSLNLLKECQNRIKSMAYIHESLYQNKDFASVNFSDYISTLTKNLVHSYTINSRKVKLLLDVEEVYLNIDTSIPCGLIVNEIISNSLKYAFPNDREGVIFVKLKLNKKEVTLNIGDNGVGLPKELDYRNTNSLGLQLVTALTEQIDAELIVERDKGTIFNIKFLI